MKLAPGQQAIPSRAAAERGEGVKTRKMYEIEDIDKQGNHGMTFLMAYNKGHARQIFLRIHNRELTIVSCDSVQWSSFAMWKDKLGATGYLRRA